MRLWTLQTFALITLIASSCIALADNQDTLMSESVIAYIKAHPRKTTETIPRPWDFPFSDNSYRGLLSEVLAGESNVAAKEQIEAVIKLCQSFDINATREDLSKKFITQGGFSNRRAAVYIYKPCPTIKIDVKFLPVGPEPVRAGSSTYPLSDKILSVSPPYVGFMIID